MFFLGDCRSRRVWKQLTRSLWNRNWLSFCRSSTRKKWQEAQWKRGIYIWHVCCFLDWCEGLCINIGTVLNIDSCVPSDGCPKSSGSTLELITGLFGQCHQVVAMSLPCAMKLIATWASIASAQYYCCIDGQCPYKDPLVPGDCFQTQEMCKAKCSSIHVPVPADLYGV